MARPQSSNRQSAARRTATRFEALRVEGGLFPGEFLDHVNNLESAAQSESDYAIPKGLKLRDEIGRYWRIGLGLWEGYAARCESTTGVAAKKVTVDQWLTPLMQQVLGFSDIHTIHGRRIMEQEHERLFPLSHLSHGDSVALLLTAHGFELDRGHTIFGEESRKRSPHGMVQEFLNAEDACLWSIVSNGEKLRLLRDNPSLTRPAYLEVDLRRMFEEELYADFAVFWLTLHASRFEAPEGEPQRCILEQWREEAHEVGERALERLRHGVEKALRALGNGFLAQSENGALRQAISDGTLTTDQYFQQLLRLVYRLIFLTTVEERGLLHTPNADEETRSRYSRGYALGRLRELALKQRYYDRHHDLWDGLQITFRSLQSGQDALGVPPLGGLFAGDQCPALDAAKLPNSALMQAMFALCYFRTDQALSRINYRDMDTEELGSVYESLLELLPKIRPNTSPWRFGFIGDDEDAAAGTARKLSGSYYTPDSLVQELIKSALEPVIADRMSMQPHDQRAAILAIKVCDPASGSGHFLLAAARRMAAELARIDAGADQPTAADYRHAMREVVAHCIYGVDINPLAVELCKTALWLETVEPGKPLGFLDARIRCGNSLVGVLDPELLNDGIPANAYKALTGDDKPVVAQLKKDNRATTDSVQGDLFGGGALEEAELEIELVDEMPEETPEQIAEKRQAWIEAQQSDSVRLERLTFDTFTAAFFAPKTVATRNKVPVNQDLSRLRRGLPLDAGKEELIKQLAKEHNFFHWHLAFPEVFEQGGFDCVLGNPPWERIKLQEKEFFASRSPEIADARNAAARTRMIQALNGEDAQPAEKLLYQAFMDARHAAEAASHFVRNSRFPLTGRGDVNLYALFAEQFLQLSNEHGRSGVIVPTGIATDDSTKAFFDELSAGHHLVSLIDFENREKLFKAVDSRMKFCLLTLAYNVIQARFLFFATNTEHLRDELRSFTLAANEIALLNPNTRTCPIFRSQMDAELTKKIYRHAGVLIDESKGEEGNPWGITFSAMFHMSGDSGLFRTYADMQEAGGRLDGMRWHLPNGETFVQLYEAKMVHQFDHRWATYETNGSDSRDCTQIEKQNSDYQTMPRYWIAESEVNERLAIKGWNRDWLMGWRDICRSTDERTVIAGVIPRNGAGDTFLLMFPSLSDWRLHACLLADQNSIPHDFVARQKIGGTHLKYHVKKQLVSLPPSAYSQSDLDFIVPRVLELTYTAHDLKPFAEDLGYDGDPFPWDEERRAQLRAELDACYAKLYGLTRDELRYILDPTAVMGEEYPSETFRVLKNKELHAFGEYRTQRLVLEAWDKLESGELK